MLKKGFTLMMIAVLAMVGLVACSGEKEPQWTYDKDKMQFVGQEGTVQVLGATKIETPEGQKAVRVHYQLSNTGTDSLNAYTLLMKIVLDVKQGKDELQVASLVFSKDEEKDKMANKCHISPKQQMEVVVDYAVANFDQAITIDFSDYGTEVDASAILDVKDLEQAPVAYFETKSE